MAAPGCEQIIFLLYSPLSSSLIAVRKQITYIFLCSFFLNYLPKICVQNWRHLHTRLEVFFPDFSPQNQRFVKHFAQEDQSLNPRPETEEVKQIFLQLRSAILAPERKKMTTAIDLCSQKF